MNENESLIDDAWWFTGFTYQKKVMFQLPLVKSASFRFTWPNRPQVLVLPALFGLGVHARHPDDTSGPPRRERLDFDGRNGTGGESEMKTAGQLGVGGHDFFGGIQMFDPIIAMFLRGALCP